MAGHDPNLLIGKVVHTPTLRNDVTNKLVVLLKATLLVGLVRIAVEHTGATLTVSSHLDRPGVFEFRTVVRVIPNSG